MNMNSKQYPRNNNCGHGVSHDRGGYRGWGRDLHWGHHPFPFFSSDCPTCQVCLKPTHTTPTCYHLFNQSYQSPSLPSYSAHFSIVLPFTMSLSSSDNQWYPNLAATHHFTHYFSNLSITTTKYKGDNQVCKGDGTSLLIHHVGSSTIASTSSKLLLSKLCHVPSISKNLILVKKFCDENYVFFEIHAFFCLFEGLSYPDNSAPRVH